MKRFMYLSIGVLCLMTSTLIGFHLGSQTARAQTPGPSTAFQWAGIFSATSKGPVVVMLENGDIYANVADGPAFEFGETGTWFQPFPLPPVYLGNFWNGAPVPTSNESWGSIKGQKR